eukprot:TRINITY_DN39234_c0_g1_i1.p1 TRINITY_DN39234_c0_g1~~TRINITY_DN39234_c0_g1_i1.p1  ORF type:complete len:638 (+),score=287.51 TRINITY_DN39234_c0_g1_i1:73-1986(+)
MVKANTSHMRKSSMRSRRTRNRKDKTQQSFKRAYLTRAQAARKLQVSGEEFERLVIMKGIYPREPRRFAGGQGKDKTYYFTKDINWLAQEPLLEKFQQYNTFSKKLTKLKGRRELTNVERYIIDHKPQYALDRVIKERYPTFGDALRDLDDALTHVFLYAALPARVHSDTSIEGHQTLTSGMAEKCKQLRDQWINYVVGTKSVRKAFISIKGIYYQAHVKGEVVTWQCPYEFTSKPPKDIVHRTLLYFLEYYTEFIRFVLFKLQLELQKQAKKEEEEEGEGVASQQAEDFPADAEEAKRAEKQQKAVSIFAGLTFYISRESSRMHMGIACRGFGGAVTEDPNDSALTHFIVDRPSLPDGIKTRAGVEYVQPQWLFDSINARAALPVEEYWMGKALPPHVSPFRISITNDPDEVAALKLAIAEDRRILEDDVPDRVHEIRRMLDPTYVVTKRMDDIHLSDDEDDEADEDEDRQEAAHELAARGDDDGEEHPEDDEDDGNSEDMVVKEHIERSRKSKRTLQKLLDEGDNKNKGKEKAAKLRQRIAERRAERETGGEEAKKRRRLEAKERKEEMEKEMKVSVMDRKPQKLYRNMQHGIKKRKQQLDRLEERREAIRTGAAKMSRQRKGLGQGQATVDFSS